MGNEIKRTVSLIDQNSLTRRCHGIGGTGGEGPNLAVPVLRHAGDDEALASPAPISWRLMAPEDPLA